MNNVTSAYELKAIPKARLSMDAGEAVLAVPSDVAG
jgi:hypothetical protein